MHAEVAHAIECYRDNITIVLCILNRINWDIDSYIHWYNYSCVNLWKSEGKIVFYSFSIKILLRACN